MKKSHLLATMVALLVACGSFATSAQAQAPARSGPVAVIDVPYIFEHHERFLALKEALNREVQATEKELTAGTEAIRKIAQRTDGLKPNSEEYLGLEAEVTRRKAELQVKAKAEKSSIVDRESRLYYNTYLEVMDEVKYYADSNGITLVLRFNGEVTDQENPRDVLKELNKMVVYYEPAIDITGHILKRLNSAAPKNAGAAGGAARRTAVPANPRK